MGNYVIFVLCVILSSTMAPPPKISKQYRKDYVYNRKTDAFYKLHVEARYRMQLLFNDLCEVEGAKLMVPTSDHDIKQLHSMFKQFPDLGDYVWVGNDGQSHESAEEQPIFDLDSTNVFEGSAKQCLVATRSGDVKTMTCYQQLPFICKVTVQDAPYDQHCGVYGNGYRYYSSAGSCYKIPGIAFTWSQAYSECQAEGAHLLVINSQAEHEAIFNLTNTEMHVIGSLHSSYFFAGFRAAKPVGNARVVFKTIFNQTLEEAGYSTWADNEPNNELGHEFCGSIFKNDGKLNDIDCLHSVGCICEKEVPASS